MEHRYVRSIFLGYILIIFIEAIFLSLPNCHIGELKFIDAIFTAASATCVTGLIVTSTSENFTFLGEFIILALIQMGGIGYMSLVIIFFVFIKQKLNIDEKRAMKQSLDLPNLHVGGFAKRILFFVLFIEFVGAAILTIQFSVKKSMWFGVG